MTSVNFNTNFGVSFNYQSDKTGKAEYTEPEKEPNRIMADSNQEPVSDGIVINSYEEKPEPEQTNLFGKLKNIYDSYCEKRHDKKLEKATIHLNTLNKNLNDLNVKMSELESKGRSTKYLQKRLNYLTKKQKTVSAKYNELVGMNTSEPTIIYNELANIKESEANYISDDKNVKTYNQDMSNDTISNSFYKKISSKYDILEELGHNEVYNSTNNIIKDSSPLSAEEQINIFNSCCIFPEDKGYTLNHYVDENGKTNIFYQKINDDNSIEYLRLLELDGNQKIAHTLKKPNTDVKESELYDVNELKDLVKNLKAYGPVLMGFDD